jgi:hypothetical protein
VTVGHWAEGRGCAADGVSWPWLSAVSGMISRPRNCRPVAGPPELRRALDTLNRHVDDYISRASLGKAAKTWHKCPEARDQGPLAQTWENACRARSLDAATAYVSTKLLLASWSSSY